MKEIDYFCPMKIHPSILFQLTEIRDKCKREFPGLQLWPSYFDRRFLEMQSYLDIFPNQGFGILLELGCGIGYQSALLSTLSDKVIATDLPEESKETHSPGMKTAMELLDGLKVTNVTFTPCSAEDLPFPDNSFDTVFSSHVTEHIPNQKKAIQEIQRVLKPGGIFFCVVPSSFDKPYAFMNHYLYIISRVPAYLGQIFKIKQLVNSKTEIKNYSKSSQENTLALFKKNFPFPPPHGAYPNFISELKDWTPSNWANKIVNNGPFELVEQRTTQFLPFMPFLGYLMPVVGTKFHSLSRTFERNTGSNRIIQYFGINSVIILRKR